MFLITNKLDLKEETRFTIMPLRSICNKNFCFNEQKCILELFGKVKTINKNIFY